MQAGAQRLDTVSFLDLVGEAPASPSPDTQPQGPALSAGSRTEGLSAASVLRSPGPGPARKTRLCRGPPPGLRPLKRPRHSFAARAARRGRHLPLVTVLLSPSSPCLSWKRMVGVFFLPCVLPAFAPRFKQEENLMLGRAHPPQPRFNWSHLTPLELKNRSVGLGTASTGRGKPHFTLEGHKFLIFGGSIHYFRVPREYWRDRLLKLKACGFNTVTTYVPWNLHEPERGKFDFSGNLDLEAFVLMAAEIGLWVILRPGPYICSEMDLGGLPSWLLRDPRLLLRTTNKGFTEAVEKYFDHLIPRVIPLQYRQGGPVIAVQVENEYGSFNKDKTYMPYLHKALLRRGIVELLLTSDGEKNVLSGHTKGVLAAINLQKVHKNTFSQLRQVQRDKPLLVMEYWVGWFDRWGDKHHVKDAKEVERAVSEFIKYEISFNVYMFHGGTNFDFMNGATYFGKHTGVVTSYDYDAVLTEAGDYTEKYFKLQKLFESVSATPLPQVPKLTPKAVYPPMRPSLYLPLWDALSYLNENCGTRATNSFWVDCEGVCPWSQCAGEGQQDVGGS
ncbi:beta-galactosidase-1-like protein 3 isoform X9 [Trachypithecus francoisi]|uniref:beta-galactosidase-1-like protein 3 isoform X9 n=1 Tax=Trachypithecus francoisi TaxID=54180 RepID=UPI00141AC99D|nr:beta-galactosidase-1-like protein 3 isoform X9 [Trachypithecus francoisi]